MKLSQEEATTLLTQYQDDFRELDRAVQAKSGVFILNKITVTGNATARTQLVPLILGALQSIAEDDPALFTPSLPSELDLNQDPNGLAAFHTESFGTPPNPMTCLEIIFERTPENASKNYNTLLHSTMHHFSPGADIKNLRTFNTALTEAAERTAATENTDNTPDNTSTPVTKSIDNANFYLHCLSSVAMVSGGILCLAAIITMSPMLAVTGLGIASIGSLGYNPKQGFFASSARDDNPTNDTITPSYT